MFQLPSNFLPQLIRSQFVKLPYPETDCSGQTIIVTGANVGLGFEAARHFVRLNAAQVILACRDVEKGTAAKLNIEISTKSVTLIEVWEVDLASFSSVMEFCARAQSLPRLDVLVANAGIATRIFTLLEGFESTITVNVISTFLMALLLLDKLRETAMKYDKTPHLTIVTSDAHQIANFREKSENNIFAALSIPSRFQDDRYPVSKLIEVLVVRELAALTTASCQSGKPPIIINAVNPAYCVSMLQRNARPWLRFFIGIGQMTVARSTEAGSRTLVAGAVADEKSHGQYMNDCTVVDASAFVQSEEGVKTGKEVYRQLMVILERIQPGISGNI